MEKKKSEKHGPGAHLTYFLPRINLSSSGVGAELRSYCFLQTSNSVLRTSCSEYQAFVYVQLQIGSDLIGITV